MLKLQIYGKKQSGNEIRGKLKLNMRFRKVYKCQNVILSPSRLVGLTCLILCAHLLIISSEINF